MVVGLLPGIGAWGALMAKNGLRAAGWATPRAPVHRRAHRRVPKSDTWIHGAFALEQGFLFTAMLLSAAVVGVIERQWAIAAAWCAIAAAPLSDGPDALVSMDVRRHGAATRAGVAVRDRLRLHVAALPHGRLDDGRGW